MEQKLTVDLGFAVLTANYLEGCLGTAISIYLADHEGMVIQDIALVGQSYEDISDPTSGIDEQVDCLVWGNSEDDSPTENIKIRFLKETE